MAARRGGPKKATKQPAQKATKKSATTSRDGSTRRAEQQGAQERLTGTLDAQPILAPRMSKVPAQDSEYLTTVQGVRLEHTDDSLKAGPRGPSLLEVFHLREKIMHFAHDQRRVRR
jgi:catalase